MKASINITTALIILFISCNNQARQPAVSAMQGNEKVATDSTIVQLSAEQARISGIATGIPQKRAMHATLRVNGVIELPPQNIVSVSVPLGGYLKRTMLIPGAKVRKGSILATFEDQQYIQLQQDYLTAKSRLEYTDADYNRQKGLNETKSTSDKIFQQAKADFQGQKIMVRSLAEKLRLIGINPDRLHEDNISRSVNIYAPISGYVSKVNVNIGKYVSPSDVLFELINPDDLHLTLTVFENDASTLFIGQEISCYTNNRPDEKYAATIHLITPNIGDNRATEVHCHIEGNTSRLFPGTFVNAAVKLNNAMVTAVPEDAVVKWDNKFYVFSEEAKNTFKLLPVETGASNDGFIEIRSPLPYSTIVTKNAYTILMKMKNSGEEG